MNKELKHNIATIEVNGRAVQALVAGTGPLVIALHGFPDLPISYRHQLPVLAENGYRVIAPYMRGYFPSDTSSDDVYDFAILVQDVLALIVQQTNKTAAIIGHDWGALVARSAAIVAPDKISKIVCMSLPTAKNFRQALVSNSAQQRRSWYMFFFQLPIAEMAVAYNDFEFIERLWQDWSPGWLYPQSVMDEIKGTFRQPAVLKAALGYYRSQFNPALRHPSMADIWKRLNDPIPVSTMYLHGINDGCIGVETTEGMEADFLYDFEKHVIPSAGHFVHQEQPEIVNRLITRFLAQHHGDQNATLNQ